MRGMKGEKGSARCRVSVCANIYAHVHIRAFISFSQSRHASFFARAETESARARAHTRDVLARLHHKGRINHFSRSAGRQDRTPVDNATTELCEGFADTPAPRLFLLTFDPLRFARPDFAARVTIGYGCESIENRVLYSSATTRAGALLRALA